ncbi:MAG: alpha/beta fold hydrolase [Thermomonas sp.]
MRSLEFAVQSQDGRRAALIARLPDSPRASLLWMPALGVAARHYIPFAEAVAARGIAVFLHEWRGNGSSSVRARRDIDWGYRELLDDINASSNIVSAHAHEMPRIVGGHSLGGQLACMHAVLAPDRMQATWLVASGAPYWRVFPRPMRWWLPSAARFLQWLAKRVGFMPGRRIGFGGNEAAGVMTDWARTALSGRYAARGIATDIEHALSAFQGDVRAVTFSEDWMAPPSSLKFLLSKLGKAHITDVHFSSAHIGITADHFAWMKYPDAVAAWLTDGDVAKPD